MARWHREQVTADDIHAGDYIQAPNGLRARVNRRSFSERCTEPNVRLHWQYPDDFSVNALHRGQASARLFRPGDPVTRWRKPYEEA